MNYPVSKVSPPKIKNYRKFTCKKLRIGCGPVDEGSELEIAMARSLLWPEIKGAFKARALL